jgi:hypothetical protein
MIKVMVAEGTYSRVDAEIPDKCPNCGALLSEPEALRQWELVCEVTTVTAVKDFYVETSAASPEDGCQSIPLAYDCAKCEETLAGNSLRDDC